MSKKERVAALAALVIALTAALVAAPIDVDGTRARAQADGTPAAGAAVTPPARAARQELLLQASLVRVSEEPVSLTLLRITLEPEGRSPVHAHPGVEFGVVESGQLAVEVTGQAVTLPADASEGSRPVPEGVEMILDPGDRIAYAAGTAMTFRNPGPGPTTLLAATVLSAGPDAPPGAIYPSGTPTAEEVAGVRSQILGEAVAEGLPTGRSAITLERLTLGSGSGAPGYAGPALVAVEAGGLSGAVLRGTAVVPGAAGTTPAATPASGEEFRIGAGQAIFFPEGMAETPPLGGEGEVVLLRLGVLALPDEAGAATPAGAGVGEGPTPGERVVVVVAEARLRAAPSAEAEVLAGLAQGRALTVVGPAETDASGQMWLPVEDPADPAVSGYVAVELVAEDAG